MYDALDTILLMDLQDEFERAMKYISVATFHQENVNIIIIFGFWEMVALTLYSLNLPCSSKLSSDTLVDFCQHILSLVETNF